MKHCQSFIFTRINTKVGQKFCNILAECSYIMWTKQLKWWKVPTVVDSIMLVGASTHIAILYSKCNLKAEQMNV